MQAQLDAARALTSGVSAQEALLNNQFTYQDAQCIAIEKLETRAQVEAVYLSGVLSRSDTHIALQVRYQELGGKLSDLLKIQVLPNL